MRRVPVAAPGQSAGEARRGLTGLSFESASVLVVLDGEQLVGLVPLERLIEAPADVPVGDLIDGDPPFVAPGEAPEAVAKEVHGKRVSSVAVVDDDGRFVGLIPPRRVVSLLVAEHDEDIARMGGYMASTNRARSAAEETIHRRLWHRLPWLLVGLIGAMASAVIVGAFETELSRMVLLAFFVPAVVYMADAVGTQTEAVLIRGLAVGVSIREVAWREIGTGAIVGVVVAAAFIPFAWLAWGDASVALAVGIALLASCSIATAVAMVLPWSFQRLGYDPAFGSGPLATVVQDLLSIAVYFAVALPIAS